eukprot:15279318-Alexandrium_andersonii.AAC.1
MEDSCGGKPQPKGKNGSKVRGKSSGKAGKSQRGKGLGGRSSHAARRGKCGSAGHDTAECPAPLGAASWQNPRAASRRRSSSPRSQPDAPSW